ncbi:MAG: aminotransferase class V-fold PLP-dependent enzyme [Clostridia bacterium]|nr:aminotransferase class V-fold PLP-dependent enzyme [Clostridia bacterium]
MREIYLDNAATSFPKAEGVSDAMKAYLDTVGVNVGRGSYARCMDSGMAVLSVREAVAAAFGCTDARRVIFTAGCTAALNMAINGFVREGDTVLISSMEHNAVIRPLTARGCRLVRIPSDDDGCMRLDRLNADWDAVKLCVCTHASNVSGTIQSIAPLSENLHAHGIPFVLDAAQSAGHLPIDMEALHLAALCIPAHKGLRGPQGLGLLLLSEAFAASLSPTVFGGTGSVSHSDRMPRFLPDRFEPGTLNLPGVYGLGAAMRAYDPIAVRRHETALTERFLAGLQGVPQLRILGPLEPEKRVGVVSVDFASIDNAEASALLDSEYHILTRCGLHCAPEAHKTLGSYPQGAVRFSFSPATTVDEIDAAIRAVREIAAR